MDDDDINYYFPSILNPRAVRKQHDISLTQNSIVSRCSLSLKRPNGLSRANPLHNRVTSINKENSPNILNVVHEKKAINKDLAKRQDLADDDSLGFSAIEDLLSNKDLSAANMSDNGFNKFGREITIQNNVPVVVSDEQVDSQSDKYFSDVSFANELNNVEKQSVSTTIYKPIITVSFGVNDCERVHVITKNSAIKRFSISRKGISTKVDCEVLESSQISTDTEVDEFMNETKGSLKRSAVAVSLEIKKQKLTNDDGSENSSVLILNTNAIEKISHVIVQPPNYKFVKRNNILHTSKYRTDKFSVRNGNVKCASLRQVAIETFFRKGTDAIVDAGKQLHGVTNNGAEEMNKNLGIAEAAKCDRLRSSARVSRGDLNDSPKSARLPSKRDILSPRRQDIKGSNSDAPSPKARNESMSAHSPRKNVESVHFNLPYKPKSIKSSPSPRNIPHHKIVAGTHFAVDAFSYGEIPNVKHYFLTHFHSDHYSGLKKGFSKLLFCSKITADLCISRLGVNSKNIRIINIDEVVRVDGIEVAAVDANHCPGAVMLVFSLPNGKTLLHTGDFRACPAMESFPVFWNKDIHTVYLDTTYCNPRYDFPTQDQSLEMALYVLRQKKMALEKAGKKFSSVLIVCGTYTIGKEKFFLGMSRRVGCSVWACPEKEQVLQTVEGRPCSRDPPQSCQLHVVPMRDLTHEKLRSYLDSLQGAFTEVVAFKPSGWENGKNSSVEKNLVTIHGIPYSEHSSFSELIRFVKFLKPKQVVPTVDISGGIKSVQKYFPCPLVYKDELQCQTKVTDYFSIHNRQQSAVT